MKRLTIVVTVAFLTLSFVSSARGNAIPRGSSSVSSAAPSITVTPNSGKPGESYTVTGSGFNCHGGDAVVIVTFDGTSINGAGSPIPCSGDFTVSSRAPDVALGAHTIVASGYASAAAAATAAPTDTSVPASTETSVPTSTSTLVPTNTSTSVPTATSTTVPTATSTTVPTATSTAVPTQTPLPQHPFAPSQPIPTTFIGPPIQTNTPLPTATIRPSPTATLIPTATSTSTPTQIPTATPTITPLPLTLQPPDNSTLTHDCTDSPWSDTFTASGGVPGYTFSRAGNFPPGSDFSQSASGSDTATQSGPNDCDYFGTYAFTVTVMDSAGNSVTQNYSDDFPNGGMHPWSQRRAHTVGNLVVTSRNQPASHSSARTFDGDRAETSFTILAPSAPFSISQAAACPSTPVAGVTSTCTITETVTNNSAHTLDFSHTVTNHLAAGVHASSASASAGAVSVSGSSVVWSGFQLAPGQSASASVQVSFTPPSSSAGGTLLLSDGLSADAVDLVTGKKYTITSGTLSTPVAGAAGHGGATVNGLPATGGAARRPAL